jgi:hypothetical protein
MRSLEIVNELVSLTKNEIKVCLSEKNTSALLAIKQDLEVLEIIRKKKVDVPLLERIIKGHSFDQTILDIYNLATNSQLTLEELLKLKRWLEENNERN